MTSLRVNSLYWRALLAFVVALFAFVAGASAGVVNYDEASGGDLPDVGPLPTLTFGIGVNQVSGTVGRQIPFFDDFDSFAFTVPAGTRLIASTIESIDAESDFVANSWELYQGPAVAKAGIRLQLLIVSSPGSEMLLSPLGPGQYNLSHLTMEFREPLPSLADYTFTFELVPIPEPSTAVLVIMGMVGALSIRQSNS
jgi:hypothetical protein